MNAALTIPHFGYADEIEINALDEFRDSLKVLAAQRDVKVTYLPIMIKAASLALRYFPILNASVSDCEGFVTMHAHHHISVAMDTPKGLLVPNVKNVHVRLFYVPFVVHLSIRPLAIYKYIYAYVYCLSRMSVFV